MDSESTIVDTLYKEIESLLDHLSEEPSLRNTADSNFRKTLLLACASFFEVKVSECIINFVKQISSENPMLVELVNQKAIKRQYHSLFDWDSTNARKFYALFGQGFKEFMNNQLRNDNSLKEAEKAFMELGSERNRLVHQNFGAYTLEKTAIEIYDSYKQALVFVNSLPQKLNECASSMQSQDETIKPQSPSNTL